MRKDLKNRLSRLEQCNKVDIFKTAIVRGNSPEEQAAEVKRLRSAGAINCDDCFIVYEPSEEGKPKSEIEELPSWWIALMLREIDEESRADGLLAKQKP
jgi:hypothetical protein